MGLDAIASEDRDVWAMILVDDVVRRGKRRIDRSAPRAVPTERRGSGTRAASSRHSWRRRYRGRPGSGGQSARPSSAKASDRL